MVQCEVMKDIPADDELVAVLTVSETAPSMTSYPSVVTDADSCSAALANAAAAAAAAEVPSLSPVVMSRSPVSRTDDGSGGIVEGKTGDPSTRPVIAAPSENTDCRPCPAPISSHQKVVGNSRKKDRSVNHPNLATSTTTLSDIEQQRRSFCE